MGGGDRDTGGGWASVIRLRIEEGSNKAGRALSMSVLSGILAA